MHCFFLLSLSHSFRNDLSLFLSIFSLSLSLSLQGLVTVNIGPQDLAAGTPHLVLGLLWQIIRLKLVENVRIDRQPALIALKGEEEDIDSFVNLKPEDQLLRWLNHHLAAASGGGRRVNNFGQGQISIHVCMLYVCMYVWSGCKIVAAVLSFRFL